MSDSAADRAALATAALELVDRDGPDALTHPALARAAGVEPGAVRGPAPQHDDLIDLLLEAVIGSHAPIVPEPASHGWPAVLRGIGFEHRRVLLRHPRTLALVVGRPVRSGPALNVVERYLESLVAGGLDAPHALASLNAVVVWTHGYVMSEVGAPAARGMTVPEPQAHPHLARAVAQTTWGLPDGEYSFGLEALIEGLRAAIAA